MIIDNKQSFSSNPDIKTVWDCISLYTNPTTGRSGKMNIVTGFFSIAALNILYQELSENNLYKFVLGDIHDMKRDDGFLKKVIDLLQGESDFENAFQLSNYARNAVAFLKRESVQIRTINNSFCHAKSYLYEDVSDPMHDYGIMGSSNLTEAGLGKKASPNVELNIIETGRDNATVKELKKWFDDLWKNVASAKISIPNETGKHKSEDAKLFLIKQIEQIFKAYTPEEIYHKILFEFFRSDIEMNESLEYRRDMEFLQRSVIWNTLFDFQKSGVVSLVKLLTRYGGAILADAVGLGKTFSALGVIKYFQNNGYNTMVLCPKKLRNNWTKYQYNHNSKFEKDKFNYFVRSHTDLQELRLNNYTDKITISDILSFEKLLIVVDESHNLRNDKSCRYQMLLNDIINESAKQGHTVKVLLLSATPINTGLIDIRNQFNLIGYKENKHFYKEFCLPDAAREPLVQIFQQANIKFSEWARDFNRNVNTLRTQLNTVPNFFKLTDELIIARNRTFVTNHNKELRFPTQDKPENKHIPPQNIGSYKNITDMFDDMKILRLTAYQPTQYNYELDEDAKKTAEEILKCAKINTKSWKNDPESDYLFDYLRAVAHDSKADELQKMILQNWIVKQSIKKANKGKIDWNDTALRELSLVGMMISLFIKRLESSWKSCLDTLNNVKKVHESWLEHALKRTNAEFNDNDSLSEDNEDIETIGKRVIDFNKMVRIDDYIADLQRDINILNQLIENLNIYRKDIESGKRTDEKLDTLIELLNDKQKKQNKKVVIFTSYTDTAQYIFDNIKHLYKNIALVTGEISSDDELDNILERFAPYSKLFLEKGWKTQYEQNNINPKDYKDNPKELYSIWKNIAKDDKKVKAAFANPVDILVATDCVSEGQNLQDADMVINYDIHWNPVRLIQRFGRIDRIGSPNKTIKNVNFWPSQDIESYLNLSERVSNRMVAMNIAGSETLQANDQIAEMERNNLFRKSQDERSLRSIHDDKVGEIEDMETPTLDILSLSEFKADAEEYAQRHIKELEQMPNGAFSGFRWNLEKYSNHPDCLIALLRHKNDKRNFYLLCLPADGKSDPQFSLLEKQDILQMLNEHKNESTYLPHEILKADAETLKNLAQIIKNWFNPQKTTNDTIFNILQGNDNDLINANPDKTIEQRTNIHEYDLIAWDFVSKMNKEL